MAFKLKVTYSDGRNEDIIPNPRARIETERHYAGLGGQNAQEATFYMAWAHLKNSGATEAAFDAWVDSLADAEESEVEVRPTAPAQPAATSSD